MERTEYKLLLRDVSATDCLADLAAADLHDDVQNLAFRSMVEYLAQQDCILFLKHLEQALINRTLPPTTVLVSAMILFFSLDLLEYQFCSQQQVLETEQSDPEHLTIWNPPESPMDWLLKLDSFSSFMQDLLRCRHIIEDLILSEEGFVCVAATSKESIMKDLFTELRIGKL